MSFEFYTAGKIVFGRGEINRLPKLCEGLGTHFLVVTGASSAQKSGVLSRLTDGLEAVGKQVTHFDGVSSEPTPKVVDAAVRAGRGAGVDAVIGIGGGSVMDTAKAAAGVIANGGGVRDYLEGVGTGAKIDKDPLPFIAVPTTSGTGTEVTKNAVIMSREMKFKKSMRDERLIANIALVDPELTIGMPQDVTAASGIDAICQLVESYTAKGANAFCDAMSIYHIPRAVDALKRAYDDGSDMDARETMAMASMVSGMCLANAGLGAAHGIGAGLGAVLGVRHGIACGMLLPHVMRYNINHGVGKYAQIGKAMGCSDADDKTASMYAAYEIGALCKHLKMPGRLGELGVTVDMIDELAAASMGSSMSKNPVDINNEQCAEFITKIL
ncbi:MAG: iron-containing alcohol dehydrogenase [Clostridia bacterium]|jgi:alcohol dehydrogenase class IV|nr:iron-containing alcohol dehydrogenase [Clostridia bacterium]MBT7123198.1 iron-containing alcohol dehydrogenase [Clostridia bacterium]